MPIGPSVGVHEGKCEPENVGGQERTRNNVLGTERAEQCGCSEAHRMEGFTPVSLIATTICSLTSLLFSSSQKFKKW